MEFVLHIAKSRHIKARKCFNMCSFTTVNDIGHKEGSPHDDLAAVFKFDSETTII